MKHIKLFIPYTENNVRLAPELIGTFFKEGTTPEEGLDLRAVPHDYVETLVESKYVNSNVEASLMAFQENVTKFMEDLDNDLQNKVDWEDIIILFDQTIDSASDHFSELVNSTRALLIDLRSDVMESELEDEVEQIPLEHDSLLIITEDSPEIVIDWFMQHDLNWEAEIICKEQDQDDKTGAYRFHYHYVVKPNPGQTLKQLDNQIKEILEDSEINFISINRNKLKS